MGRTPGLRRYVGLCAHPAAVGLDIVDSLECLPTIPLRDCRAGSAQSSASPRGQSIEHRWQRKRLVASRRYRALSAHTSAKSRVKENADLEPTGRPLRLPDCPGRQGFKLGCTSIVSHCYSVELCSVEGSEGPAADARAEQRSATARNMSSANMPASAPHRGGQYCAPICCCSLAGHRCEE